MATWETAGKVRRQFADMIEGLTDEQLRAETLCNGWTPVHVLGHLTSFVDTGTVAFFANVAKHRFNYDNASLASAQKQADRRIADVLQTLRDNATKSSALPMFPEELTVADVAIHTQDVRRPLGLGCELEPDVLRATLDFLTTHKMATVLVDRKPLEGVTLQTTDMAWSFGSGPVISGPAEAVMMALSSRPALGDLTGDGVRQWT